MTEFRLPGGFNSASQNDIIQKGANGIWFTRGPGEIILPGRFLARTIYTSGTSQTHNLQALTTKFIVRGQGPGGGGGGVSNSGGGTSAVGESGSAGAYFEHLFQLAIGVTSLTYTVGQGGAGGIGATDGGNGSTSTRVTYNGVTVGGGAGDGGQGMTGINHAFPVPVPVNLLNSRALAVGAPQCSSPGQAPGYGLILSNSNGYSGNGGHSVLGVGGSAAGSPGSIGNGLAGFVGGGGSGAFAFATAGSANGGDGGNGILIIDEYS